MLRSTPRETPHARALPARLPHTIQLCIHCHQNPAGFWVSRPARGGAAEGGDS
jgi:hypothetical protein